jgi:glycosyltransferase involved in cell wall biosynthesis
MRVLIATTQTPFVRGGAEMHAEGLQSALTTAGHETEIVSLPFKWYPPERILDHILATRLFDVTASSGRNVDLLIGLKFPAYLLPHPNKVLWVLHQHRSAYELWATALCDLMQFPNGQEVRDAIRAADRSFISESRAVYANSLNVANRLQRFCGIAATPLYHPPPLAERFRTAPAEDFLFFPSRLNASKRQLLVVEALAQCRERVRVRFAGAADDPVYDRALQEARRGGALADRVDWLGDVDDDTKVELFARCLGVVFPPLDEDYGYVTLEAMLAAKPVITCSDSGGVLEFVEHENTGLVVPPTPLALAQAMDRVWRERTLAEEWGAAGRDEYARRDISWDRVVQTLIGAS